MGSRLRFSRDLLLEDALFPGQEVGNGNGGHCRYKDRDAADHLDNHDQHGDGCLCHSPKKGDHAHDHKDRDRFNRDVRREEQVQSDTERRPDRGPDGKPRAKTPRFPRSQG